ncbi:hypothetical protein SIN8267_01132 [Sinobacterium norvegicum]|uniref:RDD domain-containing protein n=1 Tax=Sinobacterium norvegicum TaxID=1641715 RepID=A0ABM9ADL1_9GAMM|nr:RDD family protein [Sinobacterium norvegicum]CAH0991031.1 hypothetical protein SIN8267_01132 [Sinobacterium norvegicum]
MSNTNPDNGESHYEYAGFWIRAGASVIDSIIIVLFTVPIIYAVYGESYFYSQDHVQGASDIIITYILPFIATILFWKYKSATPGKMAIKVKIVDAKTGNPPSTSQSIIRYLGYYVSMIPLFLGFFWVIWDSKKQGWHDKMAGTVVIRPKNKGVETVNFSEQ